MIRHEDHDSDYEGEDELEEHDGESARLIVVVVELTISRIPRG